MSSFQKPENALRRAEELLAVGQPEHALQVLHQTIQNKKFRQQGWDINQENIMLQYVQLCVDLNKLKVAREGLHQYRSVAYMSNSQSLGIVLKKLRDAAEAKLAEAKQKMAAEELKDVPDDLEADESPESLLLSTLTIDVRDERAKEVHETLRMCWDAYKMILDILRTTPKQEKVYHETAQRGLEFCYVNQRPAEFRRLCEVIRSHYQLLIRNRNSPDHESLLRPEIHLETKLEQLKAASQLNLWRESYQAAEDLHALGIHDQLQAQIQTHKTTSTAIRSKIYGSVAMYYEKLAQIFWVPDLLLFHALARMRHMIHTRSFHLSLTQTSVKTMSNAAVLAVLSIPLTDQLADVKKSENVQLLEQYRQLATLLNHPTIPTRDSLRLVLVSRNILSSASEAVQTLYRIVEGEEVDSMSICAKCTPLLEEIAEEEELAAYIPSVKKIIFHKIVTKLSQVYSSISVPYFTTNVCPDTFLPWSEAEVVLVGLVRQGAIELRMDYSKNAIYFETNLDREALIRLQLCSFAEKLAAAVNVIDASSRAEAHATRLTTFYRDVEAKFEAESRRLEHRSFAVQQRREEQLEEQRRQEDNKKLLEREKAEKEERAEMTRRAEEQKRREEQRKKEELAKQRMEAAAAIVEELRALAAMVSKSQAARATGKDDGSSGNRDILIKGVPLALIDAEKVATGCITLEDYEQALMEAKSRERREEANIRRMQVKKIDHLVRALNEEELRFVKEWEAEREVADSAYLAECQKTRAEEQKIQKQTFVNYQGFKNAYIEQAIAGREKICEEQRTEQEARLVKELKKLKVKRALKRKAEAEEEEQRRAAEAEIRERQEQEDRERREEEEREQKAREEKEERQRKLDEMAEKQRLKELEIEERQQRERANLRTGLGVAAGGAAARPSAAAAPELRRAPAGGAATSAAAATDRYEEDLDWATVRSKKAPVANERTSAPTDRSAAAARGGPAGGGGDSGRNVGSSFFGRDNRDRDFGDLRRGGPPAGGSSRPSAGGSGSQAAGAPRRTPGGGKPGERAVPEEEWRRK